MIESLRKAATGWIAKILLSLLVLSFAVWGIADVFRGFGSQTVATVGGVEVTSQQFDRLYQSELLRFSNQLRRRLSPQDGRALGIPNLVFSQLLADAHTRELNLGISEEAMLNRIRSFPPFLDGSGKFSPERFREVLRENGYTEQSFVDSERRALLREQITDSMRQDMTVPKALIDALNTYLYEERVFEYFTIGQDKAAAIGEPDEATLAAYFDQHKAEYTAPEYRKLAVMLATPETLKERITVSEEDTKAAYDAARAQYAKPERRRVLVIGFPDKETAQKAREAIAGGKSFLDVAKERGLSEAAIDRGTVAREAIPDAAIADVAFTLEKDGVSQVVDAALAPSLVQVTETLPAENKTYDEVKDEVRDALKTSRAGVLAADLHDQVEDLRAGGKAIAEIAKELDLKLLEVAAIDRSGKAPDGKDVEGLPSLQSLLKIAFEADVGMETDPLDMGAGGFAWVDVLGVTPERQKSLEEVKDAVRQAWKLSEAREALRKAATDIVDKIKSGGGFTTVAAEVGATVTKSKPVTRNGTDSGLPARAIALGFAGPADTTGSAETDDGTSRVIFRVVEVIPAKEPDPERRKAMEAQLANQLANDLFPPYAAALQETFGLTVNQALLDQVIGGGAPGGGLY
jgi:peptidyl-prolyl cis-trans isomerase D